jgi:hypothetical protein
MRAEATITFDHECGIVLGGVETDHQKWRITANLFFDDTYDDDGTPDGWFMVVIGIRLYDARYTKTHDGRTRVEWTVGEEIMTSQDARDKDRYGRAELAVARNIATRVEANRSLLEHELDKAGFLDRTAPHITAALERMEYRREAAE